MIPERIEQPEPIADPLLAQVIELKRENAALRARLAEIETPVWLTLKSAAGRANILYESMRRLAERGGVVAKKDCGRIFIDQRSLDQYIARRRSQ